MSDELRELLVFFLGTFTKGVMRISAILLVLGIASALLKAWLVANK